MLSLSEGCDPVNRLYYAAIDGPIKGLIKPVKVSTAVMKADRQMRCMLLQLSVDFSATSIAIRLLLTCPFGDGSVCSMPLSLRMVPCSHSFRVNFATLCDTSIGTHTDSKIRFSFSSFSHCSLSTTLTRSTATSPTRAKCTSAAACLVSDSISFPLCGISYRSLTFPACLFLFCSVCCV